MAAALVITGLAGSMFFDLGNILQSNHSEVKFWRGDWVRKKTERHEKKIPFPDRRTKNAAVETAMQQFFPLNFFEKKKKKSVHQQTLPKRRKIRKIPHFYLGHPVCSRGGASPNFHESRQIESKNFLARAEASLNFLFKKFSRVEPSLKSNLN